MHAYMLYVSPLTIAFVTLMLVTNGFPTSLEKRWLKYRYLRFRAYLRLHGSELALGFAFFLGIPLWFAAMLASPTFFQ